jgi:hypothetical protein
VTLSISALAVWAVLAAFTSFDFLPIWIPMVAGGIIFVISMALAALAGGAMLLGGISLWVQTELTKPSWLVEASKAETKAQLEMEILNRPKVIYQNFDRTPVYGVAVFLKSIDQKPASGRGYLIFDGQELARGVIVKLEGEFEPPGRNSRT